jgi:hypothetical protein
MVPPSPITARIAWYRFDSLIEGAGSIIIAWRFSGTRTLSETAERRAQQAVAISFFALAPYVGYEAISKLAAAAHPATSWLGVGLSATSLIIMPFLGSAKKRLAPGWIPRPTPNPGCRTYCARLPRCGRPDRPAGQHAGALVAAEPGDRAGHRRLGRLRGHRNLARRGLSQASRVFGAEHGS